MYPGEVGRQMPSVELPAHAAGDATAYHVIFRAPRACRVHSVAIVPDADIVGQASYYFSFDVQTVSAAGAVTGVLASRAYALGVNETARVARALYTAANQDVGTPLASGDCLSIQRTLVSTGLASPRCLAVAEVSF
jgi:hypothetical protein